MHVETASADGLPKKLCEVRDIYIRSFFNIIIICMQHMYSNKRTLKNNSRAILVRITGIVYTEAEQLQWNIDWRGERLQLQLTV